MKKRFSKKLFKEFLYARMEFLEKEYGFDRNDGSGQVVGCCSDTIMEYGKYEFIRNMINSDIRV